MKSRMERILIIDDDVELCTLVGEYLQAEGFTVEAVHDGENGLLVPKRDSDAAVMAVERLMDAPELRRALGGAASRAVAGITWGQTARLTLDVYARALGTLAA